MDCPHYDKVDSRILIIKLGAIGDVIRTTPLLRRFKKEFPGAEISWLTHSPDIIPASVDQIFTYTCPDLEIIKATPYDILINLDKDREACALVPALNAHVKYGFTLKEGKCFPISKTAEAKWLTGLFDDENINNKKSYLQEIFEICGFEFKGEEYWLDVPGKQTWSFPSNQKIIGLNTGCGPRWETRIWPDDHWVDLIKLLKQAGYSPLLLGGEIEHKKNSRIAEQSEALYLGYFSLPEFIDLVNHVDLMVTAVSLAMHVALGLKKNIVLLNNIFNKHEFELYGRGIILEPPVECKGCFLGQCPKPCLDMIEAEEVYQALDNLLNAQTG